MLEVPDPPGDDPAPPMPAPGAESGIGGKRVSVILNAKAGTLLDRGADEPQRVLRQALEQAGAEVELALVEPQDLIAAIERAAAGPAEIVVVGGGDGSVSAAAALVRRYGKTLGIIPFGTYNLMARDLQIPLAFDEAVAALAAGAMRSVDVGEINGRMFVCQAGFGFFPRLAYARQKARQAGGGSRWIQSAISFITAIRRFRLVRVRVEIDERVLRFKSPALLVSINSYHRNPGDTLRRDSLDGGRFALYSVRYRTAAGLLLFAFKLLLGRWPTDTRLDIVSAKRFVVARRGGRRIALTIDGEFTMAETPLRFRVVPRALKVLAPPVGDAEPAAAPP